MSHRELLTRGGAVTVLCFIPLSYMLPYASSNFRNDCGSVVSLTEIDGARSCQLPAMLTVSALSLRPPLTARTAALGEQADVPGLFLLPQGELL